MSLHDLLENPLLALQRGDTLRYKRKIASRDALPGLEAGVHEWFLDIPVGDKNARWYPPLTLLGALALRNGTGTVIWIGRCCWPTLKLLHDLYGGLSSIPQKNIFIHPLTDKERFWVIEEVLRCSGVQAVVADGSRMTPTISRRLQLAAEMGKVTALIARPPCEAEQPSWAMTRWRVRSVLSNAMLPRWEIAANKGASDAQQKWIVEYEVCDAKGALHLSSDLGRGSGSSEYQRRHNIA
jgi:hypothetical protein